MTDLPTINRDQFNRIREITRQVCRELNMEIIKARATDHMHMFIAVPPKYAISQVFQRMKGRSSYRVQQELPANRKRYCGRRFRGKGYFSTTSGNITDDVILQYLDNHIGDPTDASR